MSQTSPHHLPAGRLPQDHLPRISRQNHSRRQGMQPPSHRIAVDRNQFAQRKDASWKRKDVGLAIFIVGFSFLLVVEEPRVRLGVWPHLLLPESCVTQAYFGLDCPGCGLTRSFIYLRQGRILHSLNANRVGWMLAVCVVLQIPFRIISLRRCGKFLGHSVRRCLGWAVFLTLVLNWLYNLLT